MSVGQLAQSVIDSAIDEWRIRLRARPLDAWYVSFDASESFLATVAFESDFPKRTQFCHRL